MSRKRAAYLAIGVCLLTLILLAAFGGAAVYGLTGLPWDAVPGPKVAVATSIRDGHVTFDLTYGRRVRDVLTLDVIDQDRKVVWEVSGHGMPAAIAYGQVSQAWKQMIPQEATPPDIRGKRVTIRVKALIQVVMGQGVETSEWDVVVPNR